MFIALIDKNSLSLNFPQYTISHIFYQEKNERGAIRFQLLVVRIRILGFSILQDLRKLRKEVISFTQTSVISVI